MQRIKDLRCACLVAGLSPRGNGSKARGEPAHRCRLQGNQRDPQAGPGPKTMCRSELNGAQLHFDRHLLRCIHCKDRLRERPCGEAVDPASWRLIAFFPGWRTAMRMPPWPQVTKVLMPVSATQIIVPSMILAPRPPLASTARRSRRLAFWGYPARPSSGLKASCGAPRGRHAEAGMLHVEKHSIASCCCLRPAERP